MWNEGRSRPKTGSDMRFLGPCAFRWDKLSVGIGGVIMSEGVLGRRSCRACARPRADHSTDSTDMLRRHTKRGNNVTQNKSDLLTKLFPIAFVATAAAWLVVILITDFPAWTLAVYVAVAIPAMRRFSPSDTNDQPN